MADKALDLCERLLDARDRLAADRSQMTEEDHALFAEAVEMITSLRSDVDAWSGLIEGFLKSMAASMDESGFLNDGDPVRKFRYALSKAKEADRA